MKNEKYYGAFGVIEKDLNEASGFDSVTEMQETAALREHSYQFAVQNKWLKYFYLRDE